MFVKWSKITVADENYCDVVDMPISDVNRKLSIASFNFQQRTLFFSHINKIIEEPMDKDIQLMQITAENTSGKRYVVVCSADAKIAIVRGNYTSFVDVMSLRSSSSILVDADGRLCKIVSIEPYYDSEDVVYDIKSNKGNSKFVNGLMFKA